MRPIQFLSLLAAGLAAVPVATAATISIADVQDATIYQNNPNNSSGQGPGLFAGTNGASSPRHGLIEFNIAGNVPSGSTITGVQLSLVLGQVAGSGGGGGGGSSTVQLHLLTAGWGEPVAQIPPTNNIGGSGQGIAAMTGDVTWTSRFFNESPAQPWTTAGGDYVTASSASISVGSVTGVTYQWATAAMVSDAQGWLSNPATNFGWILINADEVDATTFRAFYSNNALTASFHPQLIITYTPAPEPAMPTLLVTALVTLYSAQLCRSHPRPR